MAKTLICLSGLPRSGKSTYGKTLGHPIVCPDAVRLATHGQRYLQQAEDLIWAITKIMVRSLFLAGHETVIVDATNTTKKRREFWKDKEWELEFHILAVNKEVCIARATAEGDSEIIDVINRMHDQFEPIESIEGKVIEVSMKTE